MTDWHDAQVIEAATDRSPNRKCFRNIWGGHWRSMVDPLHVWLADRLRDVRVIVDAEGRVVGDRLPKSGYCDHQWHCLQCGAVVDGGNYAAGRVAPPEITDEQLADVWDQAYKAGTEHGESGYVAGTWRKITHTPNPYRTAALGDEQS